MLPLFVFSLLASELNSLDIDPELRAKIILDRLKKDALIKEKTLESESPNGTKKNLDEEIDPSFELANKMKMFELRKNSFGQEEESRPAKMAEQEATDQLVQTKQAEEEELSGVTPEGKRFEAMVRHVLRLYPSAIMGLFHAIRHDVDHRVQNNLTEQELLALNRIGRIKSEIFSRLLNLSKQILEKKLVSESIDRKEIKELERQVMLDLSADLGRNFIAFTPTAFSIAKEVITYACSEQVLYAMDAAIKFGTSATPIALAGVAIEGINRTFLIKRHERFSLTSIKDYSPYIFPLELLDVAVQKNHQQDSYVERWLIGVMSVIISRINNVAVNADYGIALVNLALVPVIGVSMFPAATLPCMFVGASLSAVEHGISLNARRTNAKDLVHKKAILSLVGRFISNHVLIDYFKDLKIFQKKLKSRKLNKIIDTFNREKLWMFRQIVAVIFRHYSFP